MPRKIKLLKSTVTPEQWEAHLAAARVRDSRYRANMTQERRDDKRESDRAWRLANPARARAVRQEWNTTEKGRASLAASQRKRRSRPDAALMDLLRSRLAHAVSTGQKSGSAVSDLGCSVADFRLHIESQFQPGMSWDDRESFELDHIHPLAKADLSDRAQFLAVANWRNYQPLTRSDNAAKSDAITDAARERFEVLANFLEVL